MKLLLVLAISISTLSACPCMAWTPVRPLSTFQNSPSITLSKSLARAKSNRCYYQQRSTSTEDDVEIKPILALPRINGKSENDSIVPNSPKQTKHRKSGGDDNDFFSTELLGAGAIVGVVGLVAIVASLSTATSFQVSSIDAANMIKEIVQNPSAALENVVQSVESMGPLGAIYFGIAYTVAEVFIIPAFPLTASAGYLFGPVEGTAVVLFSASIAAAISFVIGRTLLRQYVENILEEYPKFAKVDRAIGGQGFKLMLVLRLSPIFPFALSNYLYGASSINFSAFFWGTLFGFTPGTIAFVCTGAFGKTLFDGVEDTYPWFVYAGGLAILTGVLKLLADAASRFIEEMENEEDATDTTVGR